MLTMTGPATPGGLFPPPIVPASCRFKNENVGSNRGPYPPAPAEREGRAREEGTDACGGFAAGESYPRAHGGDGGRGVPDGD